MLHDGDAVGCFGIVVVWVIVCVCVCVCVLGGCVVFGAGWLQCIQWVSVTVVRLQASTHCMHASIPQHDSTMPCTTTNPHTLHKHIWQCITHHNNLHRHDDKH
jgi:hypothetical protein